MCIYDILEIGGKEQENFWPKQVKVDQQLSIKNPKGKSCREMHTIHCLYTYKIGLGMLSILGVLCRVKETG